MDLRERILADFAALRVPLSEARAEREGLSHQHFLHLLIAAQADDRRERSITHRIHEARFRHVRLLADFDWDFNKAAIDRVRIEELATGSFVGRRDNLVIVGQSGVGKSFLIEALGRCACVVGHTVRYITSADLLKDLTASLADDTLPRRIRYYSRFDLLLIDEFGFDKIERAASPEAANLLYKIIDARSQRSSTALVTNIDFEAWNTYFNDFACLHRRHGLVRRQPIHHEHDADAGCEMPCLLLDVPRSSLYYRPEPIADEAMLKTAMLDLAAEWPTYGYRRLTQMMRRLGWPVNAKRVRRWMSELGIAGTPPPRGRHTTNSNRAFPRFANLVENLEISRPDQVWVADITYIRLGREFIYLAIVMNVFTRCIRGGIWDEASTKDSPWPLWSEPWL